MKMQHATNNEDIQNYEYLAYKKKNEELKIYQNIYILFLWLTALALIVLSITGIGGLLYVFLSEYRIVVIVDSKYFNSATTFLFIGIFLSAATALLICSLKGTKSKSVLSLLIVDLLALASITTSLIIFNQFLEKIDENNFDENIFNAIKENVKDYDSSGNWNKIHSDIHCCGIKDVKKFMEKYNYSLEYIIEVKATISAKKYSEIEHGFLENAKNFGLQLRYCQNIEVTFHRGCGDSVLNIIAKTTTFLKLFGNLLIPMLLITVILVFFGYFYIKARINVWEILSK